MEKKGVAHSNDSVLETVRQFPGKGKERKEKTREWLTTPSISGLLTSN